MACESIACEPVAFKSVALKSVAWASIAEGFKPLREGQEPLVEGLLWGRLVGASAVEGGEEVA